MAALCEMKLNLQLAKREGTWLLWSPEAEIPLAYEEELEDDDGQEILRLLGRRWTRPQRVLVRYDALSHTVLSYLCEVVQRASERSYLGKRGLKINVRQPLGESDWPEEERRQWYRQRPKDEEYYRIQRELLKDGLTRKAKLTQLPPHEEGQPTLWAIGIEGCGCPRLRSTPCTSAWPSTTSCSDQQKRDLEREWGEARDTTLHFHKFTSGAAGELSLKWDPVANSESVQRARETSYYGQRRPLHISF